jgi:hypothetical protein
LKQFRVHMAELFDHVTGSHPERSEGPHSRSVECAYVHYVIDHPV